MTIAAEKESRAFGWARRAAAWWLGELRACADDVARAIEVRSRTAITLEAGERYWLLRRRGRPLAQIDRDADGGAALADRMRGEAGPVIVEIPPERVLTKRIALPEAALRALDRVLRFEIGRHFPFPAERAHFRHRLVPGGAEGTILVEVSAVPRETAAAIVGEVRAAGLEPRALAIGAGGAALYLPQAIVRRRRPLTAAQRALLLLLALTGAAALAAPIVHDRLVLGDVAREDAVLAPASHAILAARAAQARADDRAAGPLRLEAARPPLVSVLDALTKAVPDGAWLVSLGVSGHELVIEGLARSAAGVALALDQSPSFGDVAFRSPIARDPQSGLERFEISAAVPERGK